MTECILIIDFGSQFTQLIARRIRESSVYCETYQFALISEEFLHAFRPKGVILSGGHKSVTDINSPRVPPALFTMGIPILGICYGEHVIVEQLGGSVSGNQSKEFGRAFIKITETCSLFENVWKIGQREQVWMSHRDQVVVLPQGFQSVACTEKTPFAVIADDTRRFYGVQFHPEVMHTIHGAILLRKFTYSLCGCSGKWTMASFRNEAITSIREKVGKNHVICALSGGVDSAVTAALIYEAIGDQLVCILIDHGMLRSNETEQVFSIFQEHFRVRLVQRDASKLFLDRLKDVINPEEKRRVIGTTFIEVFEEEAQRIGNIHFLAQGTLYPDVIESAKDCHHQSPLVKSHHNVGGLPEHVNMTLIEPLRSLFKDEVRRLGYELGLPESIIKRHPFPGPGLAIRLPGQTVTKGKLDILRHADSIYNEEIRNAGLYDTIWQALVVLLPVCTVGVMGDSRSYGHALVLRAVTSIDGMTVEAYPFDWFFLNHVAHRLINEVEGVNRVTYDVTSKPPGTVEWE